MDNLGIDSINFIDSRFHKKGLLWEASTLVQYCKEQKYPVFNLPLAGIDLSANPFNIQDFQEFMGHVRRMNETDLKYPVLLDNTGYICDGWHRVAKAILEGKTYIKAIRITRMPEHTGKKE